MKLIIFTNHFPYNKSEPFLVNEFSFAENYFENISIYPLTASSNESNILLSSKVTAFPAVFKNHKSKIELLYKGIFNFAPLGFHIKDFFENKIYKKTGKIWDFFSSLLITRAAITTFTYKKILEQINKDEEDIVLYFYWGNNLCWILPYLLKKTKNKKIKIIIRLHRTDLYENLNNNYAPLRSAIFNFAHKLVTISEDGYQYLQNKYPTFKSKIVLSKLGVFNNGLNPYKHSSHFVMVSVSFVTSVKRVELILESLKHTKLNIKWYHFGDGPLLNKLKLRSQELPHNIEIELLGYKQNTEVIQFYKNHSVDLFINVSSSEGLPVSIMEAASFGIPIFATKAGGNGEIVNSKTGKLIPINFEPQQLSDEITSFLTQTKENILQFRINARKKYENELDANTNYKNFYTQTILN
ncbi:MAG: glycosyltransferase [Bacteroidota bacterium]